MEDAGDQPPPASMDQPAPRRPRIVFGSQAPQEQQEDTSELQEQREKHRQRAERFKTEYVAPEKHSYLMRHEARRERIIKQRSGFATGSIDPFSEEEMERRRARASRFGVEEPEAPTEQLAASLEEERKRRARADKFQTDYMPPTDQVLMDVDVLEGRRDVPVEVPRRMNTVHLFGVDVMSTGDVLKYFTEFGPKYVEWINDSSCNVLFADENTVKRLLIGMGTPLPNEDQMQSLNMQDPTSAIYLWYKGPDFVKAGTPVPLLYRVATDHDGKPMPSKDHVSRGLWRATAVGSGGRHGKRQRDDGDAMQHDAAEGRGRGRGRGRRRRRREDGSVQEMEVEVADPHSMHDDRTGGEAPQGGGFRADALPG